MSWNVGQEERRFLDKHPYVVLLAMLVAGLVAIGAIVWIGTGNAQECERAGGVDVRGACIDRDAVIEP